MQRKIQQVVQTIKSGGVVVVPTDTIYGMVVSALNARAIEMLYTLRRREKGKPCIVLVAGIDDIERFGVVLTDALREALSILWSDTLSLYEKRTQLGVSQGGVEIVLETHASTVVLSAPLQRWKMIHRGKKSIAFRKPSRRTMRGRDLHAIMQQTGPLLAPSANVAGDEPPMYIEDIKKSFGDGVQLYVAYGRKLCALPSQLFVYAEKKFTRIR